MNGHEVVQARSFDVQKALADEVRRPKLVESLPSWMQRDTTHVRYGGQDIDLDEATLPRLDGIMGAVHLFRKSEANTPHTARLDTPQTPPEASPVAQLLAWGFLGVNVLGLGGGAVLRKLGNVNGIPGLVDAGRWMQRGVVALDTGALVASCAAPVTEVTPVVAPMEFQVGDGVHPETAGLTNFPLKDLAVNLSKVDTSKAPEVTPLFTALKDSVYGSSTNPIRLAVNGATIDLTINNPDAAVATFQHVSDGKGFSFDFAMVPLGSAIVDPTGKEHVLVSFRDASGTVVVRQGIWDKSELSDGSKNAGTLRFVEWGADAGSVNARLLMQVQTDTSRPDYTLWTLIDTDTSTQLSLESEHAISVAATPSFSDSLVSFGSKPSYSTSGETTQPEALPTTIALTPTAEVPTVAPSTEGVPTETGPVNGETKSVTENGHEYLYVYNAELGQWTREIANFPLFDYPLWNFLPYKILITENTPGERNLYAVTHTDNTAEGSVDATPIRASLGPKLRERYFQNDTRGLSSQDQQRVIANEMQGLGESGHEQAYMPIIISNGEEKNVKISESSGITLTIMDKDTLMNLGGDKVSTWHVSGITMYSEVYGVDAAGNMLVRFAVDGSIANLSEEDLRRVLLSFPANFVEHKDQREQGLSDFANALAIVSSQPQLDGAAHDLEIQRLP